MYVPGFGGVPGCSGDPCSGVPGSTTCPFYCSSSITGFYNMTVGNITWETKCRMNGIPGCGDGAWTQVMRINGSKVSF